VADLLSARPRRLGREKGYRGFRLARGSGEGERDGYFVSGGRGARGKPRRCMAGVSLGSIPMQTGSARVCAEEVGSRPGLPGQCESKRVSRKTGVFDTKFVPFAPNLDVGALHIRLVGGCGGVFWCKAAEIQRGRTMSGATRSLGSLPSTIAGC